ncbi:MULTISPECIES: class I SAM-dependent methyltransferase [Paenibacillus]|uniref:Class I SAM-dependent methyltransferase n=1 Tax=Paenibacillus radicis (ex Xue et al. 2023) TaxID=2972489 RepID=A0ABT1YGQ9_9BACL|nr:class I SAM-dependent methyltransferase [Paenibacillus radicis (ex Xue et al. 2023)]MCR8632387.1 class I SAM-dependent methyltransferase [Paenibacillus radicis (ex Xue et al. 2023)]
MYIDIHQKKWDQLHEKNQFRLKYPNEMVIRFIRGNFPSPAESHVLDLGCGAGRHVICLASEGYRMTGIDFSKPGLDYTQGILHSLNLEAQLVQGSITELPFENGCFDGIISFSVIYYFTTSDIKEIISEMYRVLKKGGKAFLVVRATDDKRYGQGEKVENNTFMLNTNHTNEEGLIMHFFDEEEVRGLFSSFSHVSVGFTKESMSSTNEKYNSDLLITVVK